MVLTDWLSITPAVGLACRPSNHDPSGQARDWSSRTHGLITFSIHSTTFWSGSKAAKRFFKKLVKKYDEPRVVVTNKLRSYTKLVKTLAPKADHRAHKGLNNSIENFPLISIVTQDLMPLPFGPTIMLKWQLRICSM
ncbi:DDE-type integrase/transposase/recombinase [Pseudovibrio sp. Tun.PSC04-5.I4]|uniref:DDE-type integrase/transposase/recombinase n=1 Tax=Pseudovibrio sp. Tun.PSC04-5.I4 TaxID=1798213 RepID=UPI003296D5E4